MSWVTFLWAMLVGGCLALALPHLLVGIWQRREAHLFFVLAAAAVIGIAVGELLMMRADSIEHFVPALRWMQLPVFLLVVALVGFVRLYLGKGRLWLGLSACAMRFVCLIVNFTVKPSLSYREITALRQLRFLGENVSAPVGVISSRIYLAEFSSVLLLLFLVDASIALWRQGTPENRRRALVVGGSTSLFVLVAASAAAITQHQIINAPYFVSFPFAAMLVAMAFELGFDLFRAGQVALKLQASEASLLESEERFLTMANAAPVMIWMSGLDKLCTFFNKAWLEFSGRTIEQERGNGWTQGVHPDDFGKCLQTYSDAFDARGPFVMQYRLRHHDGEYRWLTDRGVPRFGVHGNFRGYIGACVDITDLLKKEQALHEFEERVALAADTAHLGVWELDTKTNEFWMSDKAVELFQLNQTIPVTYAMFQNRVHPEDRPAHELAIKQAIETQGGYEIEYRIVLPDRVLRWISGRARCVSDANGNLSRLLGVSMDVTAQKQAEQDARRTREEISRLSRINLLGETTASIAHELNQPLAGITSNASAAQRFIDRGNVDLAQLREILVDIAADGRRASDTIQHIRNAIKKGGTLREHINLNDLAGRVAHMLQPDARLHSCELTLSLVEGLPGIEGDPLEIQQVLINLASNAFEAMNGTLPSQRKVEIATEKNGDGTVRMSVRDHGTGISEEVRQRMFEQFFTTKEEGLGMGLAIVRSIIEAHGGKVSAENINGGGARFYFVLPTVEK